MQYFSNGNILTSVQMWTLCWFIEPNISKTAAGQRFQLEFPVTFLQNIHFMFLTNGKRGFPSCFFVFNIVIWSRCMSTLTSVWFAVSWLFSQPFILLKKITSLLDYYFYFFFNMAQFRGKRWQWKSMKFWSLCKMSTVLAAWYYLTLWSCNFIQWV